jgi:hypothetical protein
MSSVRDAGEPRGLRQRQVRMTQGKPCAHRIAPEGGSQATRCGLRGLPTHPWRRFPLGRARCQARATAWVAKL